MIPITDPASPFYPRRTAEGWGKQPVWERRNKMPKQGILHDYDLKANEERSATNQTCIICGASPMVFQWSDYSGEAMCTKCGCPYQLKWGSKKQEKEGKYPYLNLKREYVPYIKEYWEKTHKFVHYGRRLAPRPSLADFYNWLDETHPEFKG